MVLVNPERSPDVRVYRRRITKIVVFQDRSLLSYGIYVDDSVPCEEVCGEHYRTNFLTESSGQRSWSQVSCDYERLQFLR
jgi:hypothetical protein